MTESPREPAIIQDAFPPMPVCWPALDDDAAYQELKQLDLWVRWLVSRYALDHRTIPDCWHEHGSLIEELAALRGAWAASYSQVAIPIAPLDWHAGFASARQRLGEWVARTGCRPGDHRNPHS